MCSEVNDKKKQKRNLIADTAFDLFLKNGYLATKVIDIAEKAGIGKGTLYEYFPGKEDLLLYLIENKVKGDYAKVTQYIADAKTAEEKLLHYLEYEKRFIEKYGSYYNEIEVQFTKLDMSSELSKDIAKAISDLVAIKLQTVHDIIEYGVANGEFRDFDPHIAAHCISGMATSAFLSAAPGSALFDGCDLPPEEHVSLTPEDMCSMLLYGIKA